MLCIRRYRPEAHFSQCVAKDVVMMIAKLMWADRRAQEWKAADKLAYDLDIFHCAMPVPFVTVYGPSCFRCQCGVPFGDPQQPLQLDVLRRERGKHFEQRYHSDSEGRCTLDSVHFPLNRAVQAVCSMRKYLEAQKRVPEMTDDVVEWLVKKTCNIVRPHQMYSTIREQAKLTGQVRNPFALYPSLITEDVEICLDDYLRLRATPHLRQLVSSFDYFLFERKAEIEHALLRSKEA